MLSVHLGWQTQYLMTLTQNNNLNIVSTFIDQTNSLINRVTVMLVATERFKVLHIEQQLFYQYCFKFHLFSHTTYQRLQAVFDLNGL